MFAFTVGYYGKKIDPEPGRCRRTDGKKWRCSKDAHPDSKYCERHMNRSRYRSRKPVESQAHAHAHAQPYAVISKPYERYYLSPFRYSCFLIDLIWLDVCQA